MAAIGMAAMLYVTVAGAISLHAAQDATTPPTSLANALPPDASPEYIFKNNCATCHAADGTGSNPSIVGFSMPFPNGDSLPDFTDCTTNTPEPFVDWSSVIHRGGPIRGLDRHMPAFGDALTDDQIDRLVHYLWSRCTDSQWPRGDLNFPRAFFTEKAFPESESIWTSTVQTKGAKQQQNLFTYEHRIQKRSMYEVTIPVGFMQSTPGGAWDRRGLGDVEFALRRDFFHSLEHGAIFGAGGAVTLPTGKEETGLGEGVTVWEPFAMFDKAIGSAGFVQLHGGYMASSNRATVENETYLRQAWGWTFAQDHGFGRAWTPMAEVLWSKESHGGASVVDVVPQMQVSLNKLQHILISAGVSIPAAQREGRHPQFLTYFLWDWADGGLTQYWK
jgi:mono/diheme cytochrome c family protein